LQREFAAKGIRFRPRCYFSDSWGCPDKVPVIGIPFYMADKRLMRIEEEQTGEIEDDTMLQMLLRHEGGHAVNYAYRLWEQPEWGEAFGRFETPYRDAFEPNPFSRDFVRHLSHGQAHRPTYAQKHPDEDFAETFAVWLTPRSGWRIRYAAWPALRKLECVAKLVRRFRGSEPLCSGGELAAPVENLPMTLAEHYGQRAERYRSKAQGFLDDKLRIAFPQVRAAVPAVDAWRFLQKRKKILVTRVAQWSGMETEDVGMVLHKITDRSRALGLRVRMDKQEERLLDVASLLTALVVQFNHTGRFV
jgi:hypothetical protein